MINLSSSINLTSFREEIRKMITLKDQYVAQRARNAYIAIVSKFEASFDLSFAVRIINSKEEDAKRLNQRLQWQLRNSIRELRFVSLDLNQNQLKLMIVIDAAFVNTTDLHNQIGYVICLIDDVPVNLIYWSSIKCKRAIRSVLTVELYVMINDFDVEAIIKSIFERMLHISLSLILLIDSKFLYDCLVKLDRIAGKKLIIDLMCLRQSYEGREIAEIRWIDENINSADAMIKFKFCNVLISLIDTNFLNLKITAWVDRWLDLDEINRASLMIKIFDDQNL